MKNIQVGVVGVGVIGNLHAKKYFEIASEGRYSIDLVGVIDVDKEKASEVARKYNTNAFSSLDEMIKEGVEAVTVAVPTTYHKETAMFFLNKGVHVLLEKPITRSVGEADDLIAAVKNFNEKNNHNLRLMIGHIERFNPAVTELYQMVDRNVDPVHTLNVQRLGMYPSRIKDVGTIVDMAIHDIDVANYIFKDNPESVFCETSNLGYSEKYEDSAHLILRYSGGRIANITANWATSRKIRKLTALTEDRFFELDYINRSLSMCFGKTDHQAIPTKWADFKISDTKHVSEHRAEPLKLEVQHFLDCIMEPTKKILTSSVEGRNNLAIAIACLRSAKEKKPISLEQLLI